MDFRLTKEEALFQKMCREFALNEVEPIAAEIDAEERYPEETVQKLMKYGLMGIQFPKEVGGSGGNYICYSIAIEEMSRVCGTTGGIMSAHGTLGAWPIYAFGTPEQKEKWLRPLIEPKEGAKIGAFGLTEPNAGIFRQAAPRTAAVLPHFCCRGGCFRRRNRVCTGYRSQSVRLCGDVGFRDVRLFPERT